jgi:hypothetical protein
MKMMLMGNGWISKIVHAFPIGCMEECNLVDDSAMFWLYLSCHQDTVLIC